MKYILTFEKVARFSRRTNFDQLDKEDSEKVEAVVRHFIDLQDILGRIDNLEYEDFYLSNFNYKEFFNESITAKRYQPVNVYYVVDKFVHDNHMNVTTPAVRNSMHDMIKKIYKEFLEKTDFEDRMNKKLIEELEKHPDEYPEILSDYGDKLTDKVKNACRWMIEHQKYNL